MWSEGAVGVPGADGKLVSIKYWVKHYEEPSQYGIEGGRISKLTLKQDGEVVANYDRGWDIEPQTQEAKAALAILMLDYNRGGADMKWFKVWMVVPGTDGDAENGPCEPQWWNDMVQAEDEASAIRQSNEKARTDWKSPTEYEPGVPGPSEKEMGSECPVCTGAQEVTDEEYMAWIKELYEELPLSFR